jgi:hypothetical protein
MIALKVGNAFQSKISALQQSDGINPPPGVAVGNNPVDTTYRKKLFDDAMYRDDIIMLDSTSRLQIIGKLRIIPEMIWPLPPNR